LAQGLRSLLQHPVFLQLHRGNLPDPAVMVSFRIVAVMCPLVILAAGTTAAPKATTAAPKATTAAPKVTAVAPKATTAAPKATTTAAPKLTTASPKAITAAPKATTVGPVTTPAPKVTTAAPKATTAAPQSKTPVNPCAVVAPVAKKPKQSGMAAGIAALQALPLAEKAGIAAGGVAGAAAIAGGIAGAIVNSQNNKAAPVDTSPTVVTVEIPVEVPVGPISMRLYDTAKVNKNAAAAASTPQGVLISMFAFVFFGCVFLGISGFMYIRKNRRSGSFTRVSAAAGDSEDAEAGLLVE